MTLRPWLKLLLAGVLLGGGLLSGSVHAAGPDAITTRDGVRVEGRILDEGEDHVLLSTTEYGDLRFPKTRLKEIRRSTGARVSGTARAAAGPAGQEDAALEFARFVKEFQGRYPDASQADAQAYAARQLKKAGKPVPDVGLAAVAAAPPAPGAPPAPAVAAPQDPFGAPAGAPVPEDPFGAPPPAAAEAPAGNDPFGAPPPPPPAQGAPAGADPFGAPPPGGGPPPGGADPFGADPFGAGAPPPPPPAGDLFAGGPPPGGPPAAPSGEGAAPEARKAPAVPVFKKLRTGPPPEVQSGFDAVVWGQTADLPIEARQPGTEAWDTVTNDLQLKVGSQVKTGQTRTTRLLLREKKDEIRLPHETHIEVQELKGASDEVTIFLHRGSIWSQVAPRGQKDAFRVRTPELTAGVRGTVFSVERVGGASKVSVVEGSVHVTATNTGTHVTLKAGQAAVVNISGQILDLIATPVDQQKIWDTWDQWAQETTNGAGTLAGAGPVGALSQQIAADNARWEADMQEYMQNVAEQRYLDKLDEYAKAFLRFADDTGIVPTTEEGWSQIKFGTDLPGWKGPYVEGPVPPLDPWKRPLIYRLYTSPSGKLIGRVYSVWQDGRDQGGTNSSVDRAALVLYPSLKRFENDPKVNPPAP